MTLARTAFLALSICACGYHSMGALAPDHPAYCVTSEPGTAADANASVALAVGVRGTLAQFGVLRECVNAQRVVVELRQISVLPEGISVAGNGAAARGARVVATAHAIVLRDGSDDPIQEIVAEGECVVETPQASWISSQVQSDARATASKRAGEAIARRLLGVMAGSGAP